MRLPPYLPRTELAQFALRTLNTQRNSFNRNCKQGYGDGDGVPLHDLVEFLRLSRQSVVPTVAIRPRHLDFNAEC